MGTDKYAHQSAPGAGKQRKQSAVVQQRDEFVRLELSSEQIKEYRAWREDVSAWSDVLQEMVEDGYKFTLRWDDYSSSPAAFAFPGEDNSNRGYILSGRGGSVLKALTELLFKHSMLLRGSWSGASGRPGTLDDPDW